jgi:plasmid stability protein
LPLHQGRQTIAVANGFPNRVNGSSWFKAGYLNRRMFVLVNEPLESWRHPAYVDINAIISMGMISMPAVTIRNLSDETHRALRVRAAHHGRSTEAEIRDIIEAAVRPPERVKLGSLLVAIGRDAELSDSDVEALQKSRDKTPAEPMTFE